MSTHPNRLNNLQFCKLPILTSQFDIEQLLLSLEEDDIFHNKYFVCNLIYERSLLIPTFDFNLLIKH